MTRIVLAVCVVLLSACGDRESYTNRAEGIPLLLGEFQSYSSEQEVRAALAPWRIQDVERSSLAPGDRRPPYDIVTLAVVEYQHLGVMGELRLGLFNNRLMNVWFYPTDIEAYMAALKRRDVAVTTELTGRSSTGTLRVWSQRDFRDRTYVSWSDGRLEDQSGRWISRYS
jgi:hypothetical protein